IRRIPVSAQHPSLKDNTADVDRLLKGIGKALGHPEVRIPLALAREVPSILRTHHFKVHAHLYYDFSSWHVIDLTPASEQGSLYGFAMDLGTSVIAVRLLDLATGEIKEETSFLNPQIEVGPDILTRIHFAEQGEGLRRLRSLLLNRLNQEIGCMADRHGISTERLVGASVAGNTTMTHLFLGLDPHWICREPYIPVLNRPGLMRPEEVGLRIRERGAVFVFPNAGSYFGGDLIAGVLASGMNRREETNLLVDVGTNAEVVLGNRDWLVACAGAAGPALEGGVASMGMMAGPGVIDKVVIDPDTREFRVSTIGGLPPVGICGSGMIDLVAQLYLAGMIDMRGKYVPEKCRERFRTSDGMQHLIVVSSKHSGTGEDLTLSQAEIDALMRSKAAMYTILTTVTRMVHLEWKDFSRFFVAGTFGSYINPRSAIVLGMLPDLPIEEYEALGNTSLAGATMALLSLKRRQEVDEIRDRVTYVEMNVNQEFMNQFSAAKFIPHTDRALFPSVP
ncbi:MAG: ASKHA domain-containing protein, partial [Deltaproteobacteria bacterium]